MIYKHCEKRYDEWVKDDIFKKQSLFSVWMTEPFGDYKKEIAEVTGADFDRIFRLGKYQHGLILFKQFERMRVVLSYDVGASIDSTLRESLIVRDIAVVTNGQLRELHDVAEAVNEAIYGKRQESVVLQGYNSTVHVTIQGGIYNKRQSYMTCAVHNHGINTVDQMPPGLILPLRRIEGFKKGTVERARISAAILASIMKKNIETYIEPNQ